MTQSERLLKELNEAGGSVKVDVVTIQKKTMSAQAVEKLLGGGMDLYTDGDYFVGINGDTMYYIEAKEAQGLNLEAEEVDSIYYPEVA